MRCPWNSWPQFEVKWVSAEEDLKSSKHMEHSETTEDSGLAGTQSCSNFGLAVIISMLQSVVFWPRPSSKYLYNLPVVCQSLITLHVNPDPPCGPRTSNGNSWNHAWLVWTSPCKLGNACFHLGWKWWTPSCKSPLALAQCNLVSRKCHGCLSHILELFVNHPTFVMGVVSRSTNRLGIRVTVPGNSIPLHQVTYPTHGRCTLTGVSSLSWCGLGSFCDMHI